MQATATVPETLKLLRQDHELSQQNVAMLLKYRYDIGLARQSISHYETGRRNPPTATYLALMDLYGNRPRSN